MKKKHMLSSGLHVLVWKEDKWFVARCVEVEVTSQGKSKQEALKNIEEAIELYFEDENIPAPKSLSSLELHSLSFPASYA